MKWQVVLIKKNRFTSSSSRYFQKQLETEWLKLWKKTPLEDYFQFADHFLE